ncbi:MAG: hypothetical protein QE271_06995 [Bacteriovoracaceae bacterium]|nr:hypothetical protein [Bacteriovoracaceae bacterium]
MKILSNLFLLSIICITGLSKIQNSFALPVDWKGQLGFDSMRLSNFTRTKDDTTNPATGSYEVSGEGKTAYIQGMIFNFNPNVIVNDHVTMKAEFSTGMDRGGTVGDGGTYLEANNGMGHANIYHTSAKQNQSLNVNQVYMEVFSDLATFKIGRMARHWGLGALFSSGDKAWDRFFTYYEGVEATFSLGNLYIVPSWSNISNGGQLTRDGEIRDLAISLLYDNPDKDMKLGVYFGKRNTNGNPDYRVDQDQDGSFTSDETLSHSDLKIYDFFASRYFGKFYIGAEVPYVNGDLGNLAGTQTAYKSLSYILETNYEFNERWKQHLNFGIVGGDKGDTGEFTALYLHPNYQIANILFRYNLDAVQNLNTGTDGSKKENIYSSSINNAMYLKLATDYKSGLWTWTFAWIYAKARETASINQRSFNHQNGYHYTAATSQSSDLGHEFDVNFDYQWNPNLVLTGVAGYYLVGDYYAFTNTSTPNAVANQMITGVRLNLKF